MAIKTGSTGDDTLYGGGGIDQLFGLEGNDALFAGGGNDYLDGGAGTDRLEGRSGNDTLLYDRQDLVGGTLAYDGGIGRDTLLIKDPGSVNLSALRAAAGLSLEVIDLEQDSVGTTLTLSASAIRAIAGDVPTEGAPLRVHGTADDKLFLAGFARSADTVSQSGHVYAVWQSDTDATQLWVDAEIQVNPALATADTASAKESGGIANSQAGIDPSGNVLANDIDLDAGALAVTELRTGPLDGTGTAGTLGVALVGTYGSLTLHSDGSYIYVVDNAKPEVQALQADVAVQDVFTYKLTDGPYSSAAQLTITVSGVNDHPIAVDDANSTSPVVEAGGINNSGTPTATGNVLTNDSDVDHASLSVSQANGQVEKLGVSLEGIYGAIVLLANGGYTYTLNNNDPDTEALETGATVTENFEYTVVDGEGAADTGALVITIVGASDNPVAQDESWIISDGSTLTVEDIRLIANDAGKSPLVVSAVVGSGYLDSVADGAGTVTIDVQEDLKHGQSEAASISYTLQDANGLTDTGLVNISVLGTSKGSHTYDLTANTNYSFSYIELNKNADVFKGGNGEDFVFGLKGSDILFGNGGDDQIDGGSGRDYLYGGSGADTLIGGNDRDLLRGEAGADRLIGNSGDDTLDFGLAFDGIDIAIFLSTKDGHDTISGFDASQDLIDLDPLFDALGYDASQRESGDGFLIVVLDHDTVQVRIDTNNSNTDSAKTFEYLAATIDYTGTFTTANVLIDAL